MSQQLTLWDQKGSGVIRGQPVVIPIENSFPYAIPLYLRAEGTNFPQLKRVVAATGGKNDFNCSKPRRRWIPSGGY
jgi:uncharacterized membrane protein (UPF0182 family)